MTEQGAQYDHIGSKYDEYAHTATLKWVECYTFFRMVGALEGKRVLDVACGFGFYTRLLKQRGAAQVTGIDISLEMIRLAHQQEQAEPLGITYQWHQAPYEWALQEAGFRDFVWHPSEVAPEDVAHYGEAYWRDFHANCLVIGLVCQK